MVSIKLVRSSLFLARGFPSEGLYSGLSCWGSWVGGKRTHQAVVSWYSIPYTASGSGDLLVCTF